jgi:hypothetical protein
MSAGYSKKTNGKWRLCKCQCHEPGVKIMHFMECCTWPLPKGAEVETDPDPKPPEEAT